MIVHVSRFGDRAGFSHLGFAPSQLAREQWTKELARIQHAQPVADPDDLVEDIWESDEELDSFLAGLRASRNASLA